MSLTLFARSQVPPFLAYYAALTSNQTMMTEAYNQCRLYRQYLGSDSGLWKREQHRAM